MSWYGGFAPYVPVAKRRANARREMDKLRKKGQPIEPVSIDGRKIAHSFWGKGWCDHLEGFSDYSNRLPRGRTYVRNGSVCHLAIEPGRLEAYVSGSELYTVTISVTKLKAGRWEAIKRRCAGQVGSILELLQGKLSEQVMAVVADRGDGLFPKPGEIKLDCSCPDGARMCKHVAAVLYGIGARLDHQPELLFVLRKVDQQDLIANVGADLSKKGRRPAGAKVLASDDLSEMFGIEIAPARPPKRAASGEVASKRSTVADTDGSSRQAGETRARKPKEPAPKRRKKTRRLTPAKRRAISERMRQYWAARRDMVKKRKASQSS
jgi:uncharacterized Zn finger protein